MKTTFIRTHKDTAASSVLLAAMFVLSGSAFWSTAQATAQTAPSVGQATFVTAAPLSDDHAIVVTAKRLVKGRA
jgi:hypothetical protein